MKYNFGFRKKNSIFATQINNIIPAMANSVIFIGSVEQLSDSITDCVRNVATVLAPQTNNCDVRVAEVLNNTIILSVGIIAAAVVICVAICYLYRYGIYCRDKRKEEKESKKKLEEDVNALIKARTADLKKEIQGELEQKMNLTANIQDIVANAEKLSRHGHDVRVCVQNGPYKVEIKPAESEK